MRYKGLDLNLLHALDVLLETRNVTKAADRLALSQSALSAALARLRQFFGDELLMLDGRRMHVTPFAEQLAQPLRDCLRGADAVISSGRAFDPATSKRSFRIAATDYVITAVLSRLSERLAIEAPEVRLEFVGPDNEALALLDRGELDMVISPREFLLSSHPVEELFHEEIVVAGWSGNRLFDAPISEEAFFSAGHVTVALGMHREKTFADSHVQNSLGRARRIEAVACNFTVVPWMLQGTQRLAMMHQRLAVAMGAYLPIRYAPLPFPFPRMREDAQIHRTKAGDGGLRWLIDRIREAAEV